MAYLDNEGTWTKHAAEAADFADATAAVNAKRTYQLRDVEIVLEMVDAPDPEYDLIVPLT